MNGRLLTLGIAAAIAATTALTGCGSQTVSQPSSAPMSRNPTTPAPSPSGTAMVKEPIKKSVAVSGQGRTLTVSAVTTGCKTDKLVADESTASVTVTVEVTDHHKTGQMCPDFAKLTRISTTLKAPLGKRQVFDGATGKQLTATT
jgi:hypothetical protein